MWDCQSVLVYLFEECLIFSEALFLPMLAIPNLSSLEWPTDHFNFKSRPTRHRGEVKPFNEMFRLNVSICLYVVLVLYFISFTVVGFFSNLSISFFTSYDATSLRDTQPICLTCATSVAKASLRSLP